ncbi:VOC family protein [Maritalea porphyrae]|uniref:Bleomycin resistance protein n=1 Tax=Maritalea porphyrae TaxID=880732 RepID=A0ABQ5UMC7_9HYPH|nr:VOC family protein [Maritalea porphyrae]GLQ16436.1 bleomycin resistance protein [Maritalea porphyrae]
MILKIDYVELPGKDLARSKHFFAKALGWTFTDYGPQYFSFDNAGLDGGMDGTPEALPHALVVLKADDLEAAQTQIESGGGEIVKPIFSFPGGRRFHFKEPSGNEMAVWSDK